MARSNIRDRKILFLCRDNGSLSLIAEAIAKRLLPPKTQVFSAGMKQDKVDPKALEVLREIGITVPSHEVKGLDSIPTQDIDLVVSLGERGEAKPTLSSRARWSTWDISDPRRESGGDLKAFRHA